MDPLDKIFKAYDIRGVYPSEINEELVRKIGAAYALVFKPKVVAVGRDVRPSGVALQAALIDGLTSQGVDVVDIGMGPTEQIYFAVATHKYDGGIQVSASHNPAEYNGLKMVLGKNGAIDALSGDSGLPQLRAALGDDLSPVSNKGAVTQLDIRLEYIEFLAELIDLSEVAALKVVANNNFGASGPIAREVLRKIGAPVELIELNFEPDGSFPKGRPDPSVEENRAETSALVRKHSADLAVAWDADGDRCFVVDENGEFVEGCYFTALLSSELLKDSPKDKIVYDPRNIWAVEQTVKELGGAALMNKAGHTFIKNRMRQEDALFAGEMSGHFSFRSFFYCDNGIIPFLYALKIASRGEKLSEIVAPLRKQFPVSGEINFKVKDIAAAIKDIEQYFADGQFDRTDGVSISFDSWRLNLRSSNTEPLLRLNVEARDQKTCLEKTNLVTERIRYFCE